MIKLLSSIFLTTLLSFSCTDSPTTATENTADTEANPSTQDPAPTTVALTEAASEGQEEEVRDIGGENKVIEEPAPATTTPKEAPIKDQARPRGEASTPEPTPDPAPKTNTAPQNAPTTTDKSNNTTVVPAKNIGAKPAIPAFSHDKLDALLRQHVSSSGKVNYKTFKKDQELLEDYINLLQLNAPQSDWSKNKKMAYWINLYNAFTINTILKNYPINSITDIAGGKVWDKETINIGGEKLTLNDIEKKKLLKGFKDARVHFAVNCAAASCPPLLNKAWTEENLQRYLQKQTKAFINNSKENQLSANSIQVSQIFNWYADDFGGKDKIVAYFQKYADVEIKDKAKVTFNEYDWGLND